ncbi:MAG TPA: tyrosine-protein phosphatase [Steroidobacter sp.]
MAWRARIRTGLIAALLLALADVEPEAIASDYAESSERLREAYLERYKEVEPQWILEAVRCPEQGVYNMLSYLERFGGAPGYLHEIGLDDEHIERLKSRL